MEEDEEIQPQPSYETCSVRLVVLHDLVPDASQDRFMDLDVPVAQPEALPTYGDVERALQTHDFREVAFRPNPQFWCPVVGVKNKFYPSNKTIAHPECVHLSREQNLRLSSVQPASTDLADDETSVMQDDRDDILESLNDQDGHDENCRSRTPRKRRGVHLTKEERDRLPQWSPSTTLIPVRTRRWYCFNRRDPSRPPTTVPDTPTLQQRFIRACSSKKRVDNNFQLRPELGAGSCSFGLRLTELGQHTHGELHLIGFKLEQMGRHDMACTDGSLAFKQRAHPEIKEWVMDLVRKGCSEASIVAQLEGPTLNPPPRPLSSWNVPYTSGRWYPTKDAIRMMIVNSSSEKLHGTDQQRIDQFLASTSSYACSHPHSLYQDGQCPGESQYGDKSDVIYHQFVHCDCQSCLEIPLRESNILILMTPCQRATWDALRPKVLFLDSTFSVNRYDWATTALVAADESGAGVVPLAFMISDRDREHEYARFLSEVKHAVGEAFNPVRIVIDKCGAERNCINQAVPGVQVATCWFHVCQAVERQYPGRLDLLSCMAKMRYARNAQELKDASNSLLNAAGEFQGYFLSQWLNERDIKTWTLFHLGLVRDALDQGHTNNLIERFFGTFKYKFLKGYRMHDLAGLAIRIVRDTNQHFCLQRQRQLLDKPNVAFLPKFRSLLLEKEMHAEKLVETGQVLELHRYFGVGLVLPQRTLSELDLLQIRELANAHLEPFYQTRGMPLTEGLQQLHEALKQQYPDVVVVGVERRFCSAMHDHAFICSHIRAVARHFGGIENFRLQIHSLFEEPPVCPVSRSAPVNPASETAVSAANTAYADDALPTGATDMAVDDQLDADGPARTSDMAVDDHLPSGPDADGPADRTSDLPAELDPNHGASPSARNSDDAPEHSSGLVETVASPDDLVDELSKLFEKGLERLKTMAQGDELQSLVRQLTRNCSNSMRNATGQRGILSLDTRRTRGATRKAAKSTRAAQAKAKRTAAAKANRAAVAAAAASASASSASTVLPASRKRPRLEPEADPQETEPAQPTEDWFEHFAPQLRPPGGRSAAIRARDTIRRFPRYDTSRDDDADVFEAQPGEIGRR
ncbi:hypothetical protein CAOG_08308 [Capsaspora owczarzaki ATCC 30864]|uniref:hypothetical protein n=1 Tax=Capsaspora owczarzaki (strain ATCC 30864) TaxID=595528 RepID=UPI0003525796|nr:hypothetical protein CAOG_08308 [Capsaspora owczarzaki ATCC 30864]|eukprot:XP_004341670.2 hypothetical protein CAOG_08308 [Capsaspora owczarzaki ATCC 30864]